MDSNNYLRIRSKFKYFVFLCLYYFLYPICHILYGSKNNWLICERGDDAQDNGYVFYKFIRENHPEIRITYLIKKNSKDYSKVASIGKVVEFGSFKHFLMMIGCPVKISSHLYGYSPWICSTLYYRRHKTHHKHIFLQHGVIKNLHEGLFGDVCKSLSLFVCGAKPEYDFIYNEFHYKNDVPQYTGLPRHDLLDDYKCINQILYMPTWRVKLATVSDEEFLQSNFYFNWNSLINNKTINLLCKDNNLKIKFYLHHTLQKFSHLFVGNEVVDVVSFEEQSVQSLLKESLLLVTDFSSVYFDFAYMKKPMIYFQFDEDTFYDEHYHKGYFDYIRDGFGEVCTTIEDVVSSIASIIDKNFDMENKYQFRTYNYFTLEKGFNRERVFKAIQNKEC